MNKKINFLDKYIDMLQSVIDNSDIAGADRLQTEVIAVFEGEIENIKSNLDSYSFSHLDGTSVDYLGDAEILREKLTNYKLNLRCGLCNPQNNMQNGVNVTQQVTQQVQSDIRISLEQVFSEIQKIPDNNLSSEEKEILNGKLAGIEMAKDKKSRWEKIKDTLKWITEKGIEVGIAVLPYITKALEGGV